MAQFTLKTERFTCDECQFSADVTGQYPSRPKGWVTRKVHGCGMTGYTRHDDLCPDCAPLITAAESVEGEREQSPKKENA